MDGEIIIQVVSSRRSTLVHRVMLHSYVLMRCIIVLSLCRSREIVLRTISLDLRNVNFIAAINIWQYTSIK